MRRVTRAVVSAVCLASLSGCTIAGTWKTVSVDPPGSGFPVDTITLGRDKNYTLTWEQAGRFRTALGEYRWDGFRLDLLWPGIAPQSYDASLGLDGTLTLTYGTGGSKISATLERTDR